MNAPQLPAYLQGKTRQNLNTVATAGMGGLLPPHISIRGNSFTLVDSQGIAQPIGAMMDAVVVDMLEYMGKKYYENDWTPGSDEPPTCWSTNGVAPSRDSQTPQSPTCATCEWNKRGSKISKLSGAKIKACRDEKMLAILLPQYPQMMFQLVITPGSFDNWSKFMAPFAKNQGIDVSDVVIRFGFQPQVNGVMTFQATGYIPEALVEPFNLALANKSTDAIVGRNDVPIAMLPAPVQQPQLTVQGTPVQFDAPPAAGGYPPQQGAAPTQQFGQAAGATQPNVPFGQGQPASNAEAFGQAGNGSAPSAETRSPSDPAKRRRRTQAEIAADNAAKAAQPGSAPPGQSATAQPQAPFPVNQSASGQAAGFGQPAAGQAFGNPTPAATGFGQTQQPNPTPAAAPASFGIQNGAEPDPQLAAMLASLGGPS